MSYDSHEIVILTGLSGAGKSVVANCLEDIGFYCVDNLPLLLIPQFIDLYKGSHGDIDRFAIVMDIRSIYFVRGAAEQLQKLKELGFKYHLIFLDADDDALVNRFNLTRRQHPLMAEGKTLSQCIKEERKELDELYNLANTIINSSDTDSEELQKKIKKIFLYNSEDSFQVNIISFGFKYGVPLDADLIFDVRYLRNPYYIADLKKITGEESIIQNYVLEDEYAEETISKISGMSSFTINRYKGSSKPIVNIAIGCTGGRHRSATIAIKVSERLQKLGHNPTVNHRDIKL